jgi:diadenylate cyclase
MFGITFAQHWSWGVEIALMTVGIYYLWKLFHGTRGAKVLTGLLFLLFSLFLISRLLHLTVITAAFRYFSGFFFIALIIIFQPELRRALAELGNRQVRGSSRRQTEVIEEVIDSIEWLQQEKYGALIAFERGIAYLPARESGTEINATVTTDLLSTLFFPKTPLHDGGVIIQNDQILFAAAVFPLTTQDGLARTLGLRHRAALGLSEETDAVVLILSEETGVISIAYAGLLERLNTVDEARARLTELLSGKKSPAKP